jgi:hypothetical protein
MHYIFSGDDVDTDGNTLSRPPLVDVGSCFAIYFHNVNRHRTKTTDLFKAVLEDDYEVIVYWKQVWLIHSTTRNCSMQGILCSDVIAAF